jgi:hypothetical protein
MADLSPAAQAVLDAVEDDCIHPDDKHRIAAAALRAAADQVVPEEPEPDQSAMSFSDWNLKIEGWDTRIAIRAGFLAIAAELEGQP